MATEKHPPQEMQTFLPKDGSNIGNGTVKYKVTSPDAEANHFEVDKDFDPFKNRNLEHPVTDCDTLTHLLKASLGTGILAMPAAFANTGLILGIFGTIAVALLCTHCAYILVVCAHELYRRTGRTAMSFPDVAEVAFQRGPKRFRKFSGLARLTVIVGMFLTYFMTCSCYCVIIANNFQQVAEHYLNGEINLRLMISYLFVPIILLSWVPNLKYLAPVSMVANVFMGVGLGITFYYFVIDLPPITDDKLTAPIENFPIFFSITIFAIEAIGVVMPLENNMATPQNFLGLCGVLNQGAAGITLIYILLGFMGYLRYGDTVQGAVTLDLPIDEYAAQAVKILIALAVFCTFGLQFYVCLDIAWNGVKDKCKKYPRLSDYILRTVLVTICVLLAVAVPTITPFVGLIGALFFSILGLICPVVIEMITFWDKGFGKYYWKLIKNLIVIAAGLIALLFGSKSAIEDIIKEYAPQISQNVTTIVNNITESAFVALENATAASLTTVS